MDIRMCPSGKAENWHNRCQRGTGLYSVPTDSDVSGKVNEGA